MLNRVLYEVYLGDATLGTWENRADAENACPLGGMVGEVFFHLNTFWGGKVVSFRGVSGDMERLDD